MELLVCLLLVAELPHMIPLLSLEILRGVSGAPYGPPPQPCMDPPLRVTGYWKRSALRNAEIVWLARLRTDSQLTQLRKPDACYATGHSVVQRGTLICSDAQPMQLTLAPGCAAGKQLLRLVAQRDDSQ